MRGFGRWSVFQLRTQDNVYMAVFGVRHLKPHSVLSDISHLANPRDQILVYHFSSKHDVHPMVHRLNADPTLTLSAQGSSLYVRIWRIKTIAALKELTYLEYP